MAGKKKQRTPLTDAQLAQHMQRLIDIRPVANEYRDLCAEIKEELQFRRVSEFACPKGNTAKLKAKSTREWVVTELEKILPRFIFESLCPRKPDSKKLNQRMAALPEDKKLAGCFFTKPGAPSLEVLAPGEIALEAEDSEQHAA